MFTIEPILTAPDLDKKMKMEVDSSDHAMEGIVVDGDQWHTSQSHSMR